MQFDFGIYQLDADPERTRQFYQAEHGEPCDCLGCRNFFQAACQLPEPVQEFFRQLGVDIGKPAEMTAYVSKDGNLTFYDGFYHICGTIIQGKDPWKQVSDRCFQLDESCALKLTPDHALFFTDHCVLVDKDFPRPVIQLEVRWQVPWVLDEPNPYFYP